MENLGHQNGMPVCHEFLWKVEGISRLRVSIVVAEVNIVILVMKEGC